MPDLHTDAIHAFWDSYDRRTLYSVIMALERVENWAMDEEPELEPAVLELGRVIDFASDFDVAGYEDPLIRILASTKSSRAMPLFPDFWAPRRNITSKSCYCP